MSQLLLNRAGLPRIVSSPPNIPVNLCAWGHLSGIPDDTTRSETISAVSALRIVNLTFDLSRVIVAPPVY